jgi:glutathione peroxidase-family protein
LTVSLSSVQISLFIASHQGVIPNVLPEKGNPKPLTEYSGKVLLIVNTASKCGFTPQYAGLEKLYKSVDSKFPGQFVVLGFPCNQFGGQEPGTNDDIQSFCQVNYGVSFPIFGKTDVNGDNADPLFEWLKKEKPGLMGLKRVKWNFEKFLIGRDGKVVERWASTKKPEDLEDVVVKEIEKSAPVPAQAEPAKAEL